MLLALELLALAAIGYIVARVALRQRNDLAALAQGMVIGPALWGLCVNFILYVVPGLGGALVGWGAVLALGAALAQRAPRTIRIPARRLAGFMAAALAIFWVMLAARQSMKIPDPELHLGLAAYIRAGGWPPITPWNPDMSAYYHHGVDLLIGLLAPPAGPNPVFVTELIGAYVWAGFALVVATALQQRGGWLGALILAPLLLTAGTWTLTSQLNKVPNLLQMPMPTDLQTVGLRDSLAGVYWPEVTTRWHSELDGAPSNIWKPPFVLAYALTFIVLAQAAAVRPRSRLAAPTMAALVGFLGIVSAELAFLVIGLWGGLEAVRLLPPFADRRITWGKVFGAAAGPAAALALLALGGGTTTAIVTGAPRADLAFGWIDDPLNRQTLGRHEPLHGRIGLLGVGAISAAIGAAVLAWRDRLVLTLTIGTVPLMAAALMIEYPTAPHDVTRFDGHARNFALLALLLAAAGRLPTLRPRWRAAAGVVIAALVVWPTIARPVRTIGLGIDRGVQVTNPEPGVLESDSYAYEYDLRRFVIETPVSVEVASYIRNHTPVDTRIFSPHPSELSTSTGRPNALGFAGHLHFFPTPGPQYDDVLRYLEPGPVRRRGFSYMHATTGWVNGLPDRAQGWLANPRLFERVVGTDSDALYRVLPGFLRLDGAYAPASFEALRQAVPAAASVYLAPTVQPQHGARLAATLDHARLLGRLDPASDHWMTEMTTGSLSSEMPDFVALPARLAPSVLPPTLRRPVWWNHEIAVYALSGAIPPLADAPPAHFSIDLSDVQFTPDRLRFTATVTDRAPDRWHGQDWVVVATDDSPWRLPFRFDTTSFNSAFVRWFDGQVQPVPDTDIHEYFFLYEFNPRTGTLAVWDGSAYANSSPPHPQLRPGNWMLAARPNINREEVGLIPVLQFTLTEDGDFTYKVYAGSLNAMLVR